MIAETSLEAYDRIKEKLPEKRKAVLVAAEKGTEWCNDTLAWRMNWPINCVTPRTGELRKMGLLVNTRKKEHKGFTVQWFRAAKPERLF
jgi:hypothetical protein